jgi:hypothetical protein
VVVFPPRGLAKNEVIRLVEDSSKATEAAPPGSCCIVICDVPPEEGRMYLRTLDRANFFVPLTHMDAVVLVSSRLAVALLTPTGDGNRLQASEQRRAKFFAGQSDTVSFPGSSYADLIAFLVFWDSNLYWQRLREKAATGDWHPFCTDLIRWGDGKELHGYLDFSQTFHDAFCVGIYRVALQRLQGAMKKAELASVDPLVRGLVEEHNARQQSPLKPPETSDLPMVMVGSVRVTGTSLDIVSEEWCSSRTIVASICILNHQDSGKGDRECLLLWPQKANWLEKYMGVVAPNPTGSAEALARIGRTPAVARGGEAYFRLPRSSGFAQDPTAAYQDWQGMHPCIVKLGHWHYQSNHDLLTVDIWKRLDFDVMTPGGALHYLLGEMLSMLGVKSSDLPADVSQALGRLLRPVDKPVAALVYNSHPSTDLVVHQLIEMLPEVFVGKLVGLRPLRHRRAGSSLLVSPFALDRIRCLIQSDPKAQILLFDDAEISGKTSADLEALLVAAGASFVHTLTVLDRRRLPTPKPPGSRRSYWRYDVPVMGKDGLCPLCDALDRAGVLGNRLLGCDDVLRSWERDWRPMSPLTHWSDHGLDPVALQLKRPRRPYPTDVAGEPLVKLQTSVGLAIYLAEMHSMTFHDDLVVELLDGEGDNLDGASCIQILASQLLLFGEEFGRELRAQMLFALASKMLEYEPADHRASDRHLSLGALVFLAQPTSCIEEVCPRISLLLSEWSEGRSTHGPQGGFPLAVDLQVLFAWLVGDFPKHFAEATEIVSRCRRRLQPRFDTIGHIYDTLFREAYDDDGYVHRGPLPRIGRVRGKEELSKWPAMLLMLEEGTLSGRRLSVALEKVAPTCFRTPPAEEASPSINIIHDLRRDLRDSVQGIETMMTGEPPAWGDFYGVRQGIETLLTDLMGLLKLAYLDVDVDAINQGHPQPLEKVLENLAETTRTAHNWQVLLEARNKGRRFADGMPCFGISPTGQPFTSVTPRVWVLWDSMTIDVARHLMVNVIHSNAGVVDPWGAAGGLADMWMRTVYRENCAIVTFVNGHDPDCRHGTRNPTLPLAAEDLGLRIHCRSSDGHWYAHMALPRAGRLAAFRRADPFCDLCELEAPL